MTRSNTGAALAALLCALAATARCAPSSGPAETTAVAGAPATVPLWHNPCGGVQGKSAAHARLLHNNSKADQLLGWLDQVNLTFKLTQGKLRGLKKIIKEIYANMGKIKMDIPWLKFKHFEWYKNNVRHLELEEKAEGVLRRVHTSMQTMLATVVHLLGLQEFSPQLRVRRRELVTKVCTEVKMMLCEAEVALMSLNMTVPERVDAAVVSWEAQGSNPADTQLLVKDWWVLNRLNRSVNNWLQVLNDILGKKDKRKNRSNTRKRTARKNRRKQTAVH